MESFNPPSYKPKGRPHQISLWTDIETANKIRKLAKDRNMSASKFLGLAVEFAMENMEN